MKKLLTLLSMLVASIGASANPNHLENVTYEVNKSAPHYYDAQTKLTSMRWDPSNNTLTHHYVTTASVGQEAQYRAVIVSQHCSHSTSYLQEGVWFLHSFSSVLGELKFQIYVGAQNCVVSQ